MFLVNKYNRYTENVKILSVKVLKNPQVHLKKRNSVIGTKKTWYKFSCKGARLVFFFF